MREQMREQIREHQGRIYLLLAFALAGTSVITGRILAVTLGSFTITTISLGLLLICCAPFCMAEILNTGRRLKIRDWKMLLLQAVFGIFLFRSFLLAGIHLTSTVEAGILTGATPAITALLALLFLKEPFSKQVVVGIGCTVAGVVLLQGIGLNAGSFSSGFLIDHLGGNLLILCAAASESTFNVISRRHSVKEQSSPQSIHPLAQTLLVAAPALLLCLIPALFEHPLAAIQQTGPQEWAALLWYGLVITALSFVFFYAGMKRCDAYTAAAFSGMMPLTAMLLSVLLLGESISLIQGAGGILVIAGILLLRKRPKGRPAEEACRHFPPVSGSVPNLEEL